MDMLRSRFGFRVGIALFSLTCLATTAWGQVPLINQPLVPTSAAPGGPGFTLTVNGTGFTPESVVEWNGAALFTLVTSDAQLSANVPASLIATSGTASVTIVAPGLPTSNVIPFPVATSEPAVTFGHNDLTSYPYVSGLIAADFNGDGITDLALGVNGIDVLLGNGDGTFGPPINTPVGESFGLTLGDFNGDGKLDLIVHNEDYGALQILIGNGDGTFTPGAFYSPPGDSYALDIFVGDFNGDGKLDFGFSYDYEGGGGLAIYLGNGNGTFQSPIHTGCGEQSQGVNGVAVGDFNMNGKLDLAVAGLLTTGPGVCILLGNGDGTFQSPVTYSANVGDGYVATADFNGDGSLDLVLSAYHQAACEQFHTPHMAITAW